MVRDLLADLGSHGAQVDLYEELELAANELLVRAIKEFQELAESRVEYEIRKIKEEDPTREIPMFPTRQSISQRLAPTRELDIEIEDDPQLSEQEEELLRERALAGALLDEIYYD